MNTKNYIKLGGTLFIQATHKDLESVVRGVKYPHLKSVVIDTEDGIRQEELEQGLAQIKILLENFCRSELLVFIRPRDSAVLKRVLDFKYIEFIDGFVLPKFSLENGLRYLELLNNRSFLIMPSIEEKELFNPLHLRELCELLLEYEEQVLSVRFGLEDMLRVLKIRRKCNESVFDIAVTSSVLGNFIAIFKSAGFNISGGVYPCYKDVEGLKADVKRDLKEGLFSKTIIHPKQIEIVHNLYKVDSSEYKEALEILASTKAVFAQNDKMAEISTMRPWAQEIVKRAEIYGVMAIIEKDLSKDTIESLSQV